MKRYIITSAVPGCEPHWNFLASLETYCKKNKAKLLIIETPRLYKNDLIDEKLNKLGCIITENTELNHNIGISTLPINPEQVDPVSGLNRLNHTEKSVIYSSPKQRLKSVASPSNNYPRVLMTPGACTKPYKRCTKRTLIATKDHVIGAIIVEIENNKVYHFRQTQALKDGSFIDLGIEYRNDGTTKKVETEAVIPGDWHTGYTDPAVRKCVFEMFDFFTPNYIFLHDVFDGISVNHHIEHKYLLKAMLGTQSNLSSELQLNAIEFSIMEKKAKKKLIVVKSNHDEFLDRWLDEGKYVKDATNHIIGLELALAKAKGKDPLEYGVKKFQKLSKVQFLKSDDSFKITNKAIECGMHGHLGPNGSKGSSSSLETSFLSSVSGHTHSPEILRNIWIVGTSSHMRLNYNRGPSSWMHSHCIVYKNGTRQMINIVNKKWKA